MSFSFFSPFTTRKSKSVRKRLQTQKRKAYDKHKLVQEQMEGARFKAKSDTIKESSSSKIDLFEDYRGKFSSEPVRGTTDEEDESSVSPLEELFKKKHFLSRFYNKLRGATGKWELKLWQFLTIVFSLRLPPAYIIQYISTVNTWGAILVLFVHVVIVVVVALPICIVYIFLGNYSRKAYIKVWNCVPLFRGIAYSIMATAMVYELLNVAFTGLSLLYLKDVITAKPPWISCKFPNSHPNCIPMYDDHKPYTNNCSSEGCGDQCLKYGAIDYYVNYVLQEGYADVPQKNSLLPKWVVAIIFLWLLIYILLSVGLRRYRYFLPVLNIILVCFFVPGFFGASYLSPKFSVTSQARSDFSSLFNHNFWIQIAVHTLQKATPGDVITFSSLSEPTVNVTLYTIAIYSVMVLVILTITVWSSIFVSSVQKHYKVEESFCIKSRGDHVIFAVIPDVLSRWPAYQLMLPLYFLSLFLWGLSTSAYALSSFLETLFEEFPELLKWRFLLTSLLCATLGIANIFLLRPNFMEVFSYVTLNLFIYVKTTLLLITMIALFIYSLDRLKNDYHFMCGFKMENCLIQGLKFAFFFFSVLFCLVWILKVGELTLKDICFVVGLLLPLFLGMLIITFRYTFKLRPTLLDSDPNWGPSSRQRMFARSRFVAADHRFRATTQICKHNCLLGSVALKKEIKHWQMKQIVRTRQLKEDQESIEKEI